MNFSFKALGFEVSMSSSPYKVSEKLVDPTEKAEDRKNLWSISAGSGGSPVQNVTIFDFKFDNPYNVQHHYELLAKNALKKLKLIKYPGLPSVVEVYEKDSFLQIVTEPVIPLLHYLRNNQVSQDSLIYGIYSIASTLAFLNDKGSCVHGNLNLYNSVFVNEQGEWKLFGFELLTNFKSDPDQPLYRLSGYSPTFNDVLAPEVETSGLDGIRQFPTKLDSYLLGHFIYTVLVTKDFNNITNYSSTNITSGNSRIPRQLTGPLKKLVNAKSSLRVTIDKFLQETESYFKSNFLVNLDSELKELQFKEPADALSFIKYDLGSYVDDSSIDKFPPGFLEKKLLPTLLEQYNKIDSYKPTVNSTPEEHQQNQETLSTLLNYILKASNTLDEKSFSESVKPVIFKSFASTDRSVRLILLNNLSSYKDRLTQSDVQSKIFYNLLSGFQDTNFVIRETTLKSITAVIDKISEKQVNQDLLKILAKSQMDPKPSIRTNTLVLITIISDKIYKNSTNNVIITALSKSLRDSFTPCKMMALTGFEKLIDQFSLDEICTKILGQLAISLMEPKSAKVRKEADRVFRLYLQSVHEHASTLPEKEEDAEDEEKQFFKKHAPTVNEADSDKLIAESKASAFSFGWGMVNKLVSSTPVEVGGTLNKELNRSTPDITRQSTPTVPKNDPKESGYGDDNWDTEDFDDGWDNGDDIPLAKPAVKSTPKVTPLPSAPKTTSRPPVSSARKASSLKLKQPAKKTGSSLKLNLTMDDDDDNWGGDDGW